MDMGAPTPEQSQEVKALTRKLQPQCMINGRIWNDEQDFLTMGDNQLPPSPSTARADPGLIYKETQATAAAERGDREEKVKELSQTARSVVAQGTTNNT